MVRDRQWKSQGCVRQRLVYVRIRYDRIWVEGDREAQKLYGHLYLRWDLQQICVQRERVPI